MNTISITTSQNIELEYELGSLGDRVLGRIIDGVVIVAYVLLLIAIIGFSDFDDFISDNPWLVVLFILPIFFYDLICEVLFNGQSVGKKVMGIKVVSLTGDQPTLSQYLIRWLFRLVDFTLTGSVLALIMVAVTDKRQRLGDVLAGTVLVKTRIRTKISETIYEPTTPMEYNITYPEVVNLRDTDAQLIKEVLISVTKSHNSMLALQAQEKVESLLNIKSKHQDPRQFLYTILADYNHITAQL